MYFLTSVGQISLVSFMHKNRHTCSSSRLFLFCCNISSEIPKQTPSLFLFFFLFFFWWWWWGGGGVAIFLVFTAGHSQKYPNMVSAQILPENLPVCPSIPVEYNTLSDKIK